MIINNVNINTLDAKLIGYDLFNSQIVNNSFCPINSLPIFYDSEIGTKTLIIRLLITDLDRKTLDRNISKLFALCYSKSNVVINDDYFNCIYVSSEQEKITDTAIKLTLTFDAIHRGIEETKIITSKDNIVINSGTRCCPCNIEIIATENIESLKINDIIINNITAESKIIIDGINKTITDNGINKFEDTEFVDFPKLEIGQNTITVSDKTVKVTVKYQPLYI